MVDQEIIDLPNDDAQPSDSGLFVPLQKDIADTRRRSLNNLIPLMQTPWLQDIDANGKNIDDILEINAEHIHLTAAGFNLPNIEVTHESISNGDTLFRIDTHSDGHLYSRVDSIAQSITPGSEASKTEWYESTLGIIQLGMELRGAEKILLMQNGYAINLNSGDLLNSNLITPTIDDLTNATHDHEDDAGGGILSKTAVGLGNVDNTSDLSKPISTATQTALDDKEDSINKNAVNGYAGLDGSSKLTGSQQVYGTTSDTAAEGNDTRLSDDRTPLAHATSHKSGGSDAIKLDELATPDDNTNLDATTSLHGLFSKVDKTKLDNLETLFTWAASDEDSPLPGGVFPVLYITEPADKDRTITDVIAGLKNAATGSLIGIEIQKETAVNSNSFTLAAALEIDIDEFTSTTATTSRIITVPGWERGRRLKIILLQNDTNFAATGLKVTIVA